MVSRGTQADLEPRPTRVGGPPPAALRSRRASSPRPRGVAADDDVGASRVVTTEPGPPPVRPSARPSRPLPDDVEPKIDGDAFLWPSSTDVPDPTGSDPVNVSHPRVVRLFMGTQS